MTWQDEEAKPAVADPKPKRRRKAAMERKPRGPRKPAEYVIQQHTVFAPERVGMPSHCWIDMASVQPKQAKAARLSLKAHVGDESWPPGKYRIAKIVEVIDAKTVTEKRVVLGKE